LGILTVVILLTGCAKRKNPVFVQLEDGALQNLPFAPVGIPQTALAGSRLEVADAAGKRLLHAYLPPNHPSIVTVPPNPNPNPTSQRYPTLYLLADFNQSTAQLGRFYQLKEIVDELLAAGEIDSMVIVIISSDLQGSPTDLGGTFYGNSFLIGDWLTFMGEQIIPDIDTLYSLRTDTTRRAVAGLGMGGYGAFRLALEYPGKFDVVGAMSAPLSFGGTDPAGWLQGFLRPTVMAENGGSYGSIEAVTPFDPTKPATSWMIGMGTAFSPHDTLAAKGSTFREIEGALSPDYGVELPFDSAGFVGSLVDMWMDNDIENLLSTTYSGVLDDKAIYLDCGAADEFDFAGVNQGFFSFLQANGIGTPRMYDEYSGYPGHDAMHNTFAYDRLKQLLKFISENWES
jgi:S-formylglutathione hydrolase FrmB